MDKPTGSDVTYQLDVDDHTLDGNLAAPGPPAIIGPVTVNLGSLDVLPIELLDDILARLDLATLVAFRLVNRCAAVTLDSVPEYAAVTAHARDALRGSLAVGTAGRITCRALYDTLCTAECDVCGNFGGYIYLVTCRRACFVCISDNSAFLPLTPRRAAAQFGLSVRRAQTLPSVRALPGIYTAKEKQLVASVARVDHDSAYREGIRIHGSIEAMQAYAAGARERSGLPVIRDPAGAPSLLPELDLRAHNVFRMYAVVRVPWWDRVSRQVDWGFHCWACRFSYAGRVRHWRRKFTRESFARHLGECPVADEVNVLH